METRIKKAGGVPRLVCFGRGHTIHFARTVEPGGGSSLMTEQGYDSPEDFFQPSKWWAHDWLEQRDKAEFEGVPYVDKRAAVETPEGMEWVLKGPLVDVDLDDGEVSELPPISPIMGFGLAHSGFGGLLAMHLAQKSKAKRGSLDGVSVAEYVAGWWKHGATVGVIQDGQFR